MNENKKLLSKSTTHAQNALHCSSRLHKKSILQTDTDGLGLTLHT